MKWVFIKLKNRTGPSNRWADVIQLLAAADVHPSISAKDNSYVWMLFLLSLFQSVWHNMQTHSSSDGELKEGAEELSWWCIVN